MGRLKLDLAAAVLVEAAYAGDEITAQKWGISAKSIQRYRIRMLEDDELSALVHHKKELFEATWADELPSALRAGISFLRIAATKAEYSSPEAIHAVAGAVKILSDISMSKELIDARLTEFLREARKANQEMAAETAESDR